MCDFWKEKKRIHQNICGKKGYFKLLKRNKFLFDLACCENLLILLLVLCSSRQRFVGVLVAFLHHRSSSVQRPATDCDDAIILSKGLMWDSFVGCTDLHQDPA